MPLRRKFPLKESLFIIVSLRLPLNRRKFTDSTSHYFSGTSGPIETPMLAQASVERPGTILPTIILPLERKGKVDEVAPLIAYLLGPESTYTTGVVIPIDGGMCC